tara:strand:+ start:456 stop:800 length:345 start_codon:yes stop_codon:yes gene_type:complete
MKNEQLISEFASYLERTKPKKFFYYEGGNSDGTSKCTPLRVSADRFADTVAYENAQTYDNPELYADFDFVMTNHLFFPREYEYDGSFCDGKDGCCATDAPGAHCKTWYHVVRFI